MWAVCMWGGGWEHRTTKALSELTGGSRCLQPPIPRSVPICAMEAKQHGGKGLPSYLWGCR